MSWSNGEKVCLDPRMRLTSKKRTTLSHVISESGWAKEATLERVITVGKGYFADNMADTKQTQSQLQRGRT
jgi:hypothetical protein